MRARGGRFSGPRRRVLEALLAAEGPISAEYIAGGLGGSAQALEPTSVYRTLEYMEELGVVRHVHLGHGPGLYALAVEGEHEYLACERCDRVTTVASTQLDPVRELVRERFGYRARFSHFPIIGLCESCAGKEASAPRAVQAKRGEAMSHHKDEHDHAEPHAHEHTHGEQKHSHPHASHEHEHVEHEHEHSHGDLVHSHPHVHEQGLEHAHEHDH